MKPVCTICSEVENKGVNLLGLYLCKKCLDAISEAEIGDMKYEYYKSVIKKIWLDYIIEYS